MVNIKEIYHNSNTYLSEKLYHDKYEHSVSCQNDIFWRAESERIDWMKKANVIQNVCMEKGNVSIKWFEDGVLNVSQNCIDRHLLSKGNEPAIIWESNNGLESLTITYRQLYQRVCQFSGALQSRGVTKGDIVTLYMPMIPETAVAMLACARLGAVHSVVFAGFSPESLAERLVGSESKIIITADSAPRGGKSTLLKNNVDAACKYCKEVRNFSIENVIVYKHTGIEVAWDITRDYWWHELEQVSIPVTDPVPMGAEEPLFILYTSGSTGKPKGIVHSSGGYLVYVMSTFHYIFDFKLGEVFWCTADAGWITGHSYLIYAPLCHGGTTLMYEGVPNWPEPNRMSKIIDKHAVNILYTAPTAIRSLMNEGENAIRDTHRSSLRKLGSVGEPVSEDTWIWFRNIFGNGVCPVVDTWWQTETGGIMISPISDRELLYPGAAASKFFGITAEIVDDQGIPVPPQSQGNLIITRSWPGQARTILRDHKRYEDSYFSLVNGAYFTGDGAWQDSDGRFWITGRVDDVLNVAGHRMGTAEIESALCGHECVAEAAVIGIPHPIKGESICACIRLKEQIVPSESVASELREWVRTKIGAIAIPERIHWVTHMPRTRSGKIVRRLLKSVVMGNFNDFGDISTLSEPERLIELINS